MARRRIEVDVSAEHFFNVMVDYEKYPEFLPEFVEAEIIGESSEGRRVRFVRRFASISMRFTLDFLEEPYRRLSWKAAQSDKFDLLQGSCEIETLSPETLFIHLDLETRLKGPFPKFLCTKVAELGMPTMLGNFKRRAEYLAGLPVPG